ATLAAEVAARDAPGGIALLDVVTGQREERQVANTTTGGGHEHHGLARLDQDGATGLFGHATRFQDDLAVSQHHTFTNNARHTHSPCRRSRNGCDRVETRVVGVRRGSDVPTVQSLMTQKNLGHETLNPWKARSPPDTTTPVRRVRTGESVELFPDTERLNQVSISLDIFTFQVVEHPSSLTDQLEQAASTVVILVVDLEMLGEVVDALGHQRDLDLG